MFLEHLVAGEKKLLDASMIVLPAWREKSWCSDGVKMGRNAMQDSGPPLWTDVKGEGWNLSFLCWFSYGESQCKRSEISAL